MGWIRGNKQKVEVLTLKMVLVCARDLQQIMIEDKNTYHNITIRITISQYVLRIRNIKKPFTSCVISR